MRLEKAMMYCLVNEGRGLSIPQLTHLINREKLHIRQNGEPVALIKIPVIIPASGKLRLKNTFS